MTTMKEIYVGLLFFGGLLALGALTILLQDFSIFEESYKYTVWCDHANELKVKDNVLIMGKRQGKVTSVKFLEEPLWNDDLKIELWVTVDITMEKPLTLKDDYAIRIRNANLLGGKVMDINLGKSLQPINALGVRLVGKAVADPIEAIKDFIETNKGHLKHTLENVDHLVSNVTLWSQKVTRGEGPLGHLIYSEPLANNIESVVAKTEAIISDIKEGKGTAGLFLMDPAMREKVERIVTNIALVSDQIAAGEGTLGKLAMDQSLYDQALGVVDDIKTVSGNLKDGKGAIGKLLSEESTKTYEDFSKTIENARKISDAITTGDGVLSALLYDNELTAKISKVVSDIEIMVQDVKDGKGPLGMILRSEDVALKLDQLLDSVLGSIEDARESAPLISMGSFLFGAI